MVKNFFGLVLSHPYLTLLFICLFSYGLTVDMYFWKDDFAMMIKARNPQENVGFFGTGVIGQGPYSYIIPPFALLFPIFKMNPFPYFVVGLFLYLLASVSVYLLGREIFIDKIKALITGAIFAGGYVGADSIYGLMNSYQTSWVIILLSFSLIFLYKYLENEKLFDLLISWILFFVAIKTGYIRAHGFTPIIFSFLLVFLKKYNIKNVFKCILVFLPYAILFKIIYLNSQLATFNREAVVRQLLNGDLSFFIKPISTFFMLIIPYHYIIWTFNFASAIKNSTISPGESFLFNAGVVVILIVLAVIYLAFKRKLFLEARVLLFSLLLMVGNFIGVFYIGSATSSLVSTHRYLTVSLVGVSLFWVVFTLTVVKILKLKKRSFYLMSIFLVINLIFLANVYTLENISLRTRPQKKFFGSLQKFIPDLPNNSIIYFDVSNKNSSPYKFSNIFGTGMVGGSAEITSHYGIDRYSLRTVYNYSDLIRQIKEKKIPQKNVFAFYYEDEKLTNVTHKIREKLSNPITVNLKESLVFSTNLNQTEQNEITFDFPKNTIGMSDYILSFNLQVEPFDFETLLPYINKNTQVYNVSKYIGYLNSKAEYYNSVDVKTLSYFQNNFPSNLVDQDDQTLWMASRGGWNSYLSGQSKTPETITLTLDEKEYISGILFTNGSSMRTPTKFNIYVSSEGGLKKIKEVNEPKLDDFQKFVVKISPVLTDKVVIELTSAYINDSPQLAEIELIKSGYEDLDFNTQSVFTNPLNFKFSANDYYQILQSPKYLSFSFNTLSSKDNAFVNSPQKIMLKGFYDNLLYSIKVPSNGLYLQSGKFLGLNFPAKYVFSNLTLKNITLKDVDSASTK